MCLHSGVFTRAQFCHYFGDAHRWTAARFVQTLIERKAAVEGEWPIMNGGGKTCRISSKLIYRALMRPGIRHRRKASKPVVMRRLLSRFCSGTSGYELAPRRAGEGRVF